MVGLLEVALVAAAFIALMIAFRILKAAKTLAINAIIGVLLLVGASMLGLGVEITIWAVLICAFAGIPGALLVMLLAWLDIAFVAAILPFIVGI